jgi:uncharacterized membrane protein
MRAELRMTLYTCMAVLTIAVQGYAQPQYTVTDLGVFTPAAVSSAGIVCGYVSGSLGSQPAVVVPGESFLILPITGWATRCNADGAVVGLGMNADKPQAFIWDTTGLHWMEIPGGNHGSEATGINEASQISVSFYADTGGGTVRRVSAVVQGATFTMLPSLSGNFDSATGINNRGEVVQNSEAADGVWHVSVADTHQLFDLGAEGWQGAQGINDRQTVAGTLLSPTGWVYAFRGHPSVGLSLLAMPTGYRSSGAADIDQDDTIVGSARKDDTTSRAFRWDGSGVPVDLNTLIDPASGWVLTGATAITNGKIAGVGKLNGQTRAFLLTPHIEPPALVMHLNQNTFRPGETLRVTLDLSNPGPILTTDVYVGIILPDGEQVVFLTNLSPLEGQLTTLSSNPRLFARLLQGVSWPANLHATQENYWVYTRSGLEANGTYHLVVAWTKPNSLQDGSIDEKDILALDWKAFRFTGPASNLAAKARD